MFLPNAGIDRAMFPKDMRFCYQKMHKHLQNTFGMLFKNNLLLSISAFLLWILAFSPFDKEFQEFLSALQGFSAISDEQGKTRLIRKTTSRFTNRCCRRFGSICTTLFGQSAESCPFLLLEDAPVFFTDQSQHPEELCIDPKDDLFHALFFEKGKILF